MIEHAPQAKRSAPAGLVDALLAEQQTLTAVEQFSRLHDSRLAPGQKLYRDLIPAGPPGAGEQYAFEVDLDACSGCKACVAACHNLNGLEENEMWRSVGQLVGGTAQLPVIQHVTTACHHCMEPACLQGCPVEAYEKDPATGIVKHLDDQCIGCQYCMLKCPYDVPVYSHAKGIVRKCDMCSDRLSAGEAPACVQACPNEAIRIRVVSRQTAAEASEAHAFLPGAPDPAITIPTTHYKTNRVLPRNTLPADYFAVRKAHGHFALVVMLVLTQMSVGAFVVEQAMHSFFALGSSEIAAAVRPLHLVAALLLGMLGLGAAVFHLGRPFYAYRALLGLRTSWLSREILAFGLFAGAASLYVAAACFDQWIAPVSAGLQKGLGAAAAVTGLFAVFCSIMIYVDTRRPLWNLSRVTTDFLFTCLVLGLPTALLVSLAAAALDENLTLAAVMNDFGRTLCGLLVVSVAARLLAEASLLAHLWDRNFTPRRRSAILLAGELSMTTLRRFFFGVVGGILLPLALLAEGIIAPEGFHPVFIGLATLICLGLLTTAELISRYLFFVASVAPKMPGVPAL